MAGDTTRRDFLRVGAAAGAGLPIVVPDFGKVDVDFVADNPGDTLCHRHQTLHMDYGFMRRFQYATQVT